MTIQGTEVTGGAGTPLQQGVIDADNVNRVILRDVYVHDALGSCISLTGGSGHQVIDSELARCQQQGFHATSTTGAVFRGNSIHDNNTAAAPGPRVDSGWEAGGGKMTKSSGAVFDRNESYSNGGPGLWCDIDCIDVEYVGNRVHHNTIGIFYEISDGGYIHDNAVWNNGPGPWCYGAGILVASSGGTTVENNVAAWNDRGISFLSQDREGNPDWNDTSGNRAINNTVIDQDGVRLLNWCQDFSGNLFTSGNNGTGGRYWSSVAEPKWERFEWASPLDTLAKLNASPGDEGARYLTTAEKDAVLADNGIPAAP